MVFDYAQTDIRNKFLFNFKPAHKQWKFNTELSNKIVLVKGGTKGTGKIFAERLFVTGPRSSPLQETN